MIKVLYFARLREQVGISDEEIDPLESIATVSDIAALLRQRGGPWSDALGEGQSIMAAVNQRMARGDTLIEDGDEVAFFPPVTGG